MAHSSALINVMTRAAEKAGRAIIRDFGEVEQLQVSRKGPSDFVSMADTKAEKILREELEYARPDFGFILEEGEDVPPRTSDGESFVIDPIDGTTNFLHGIPHFAISIGVIKEGEVIAGVIFDPIKDEMFWAEKGAGAYVNRKRLRVSGRKELEDCLLATGIPFNGKGDSERAMKEMATLAPKVAGIRRFGSAALDLAYVAAGRYDAYWEWGLNLWDISAGLLMVSEAGGTVSDINGGTKHLETGNVLVTNGKLFKTMRHQLKAATQ